MRKIAIVGFVVALVIFVAGAIMALLDFLIDWEIYWKITGCVGGLASVVGILGFVSNPLADADIRKLHSKSLKELAETAKQIESKEGELKQANDKVASLQLKSEELEVLVKKASLCLFYNDELQHNYQKLLSLVQKNQELKDLIVNIQQTEEDAKALNAEIEQNDDVKDIIDMINKAKKSRIAKHNMFEIIFGSLEPEITLSVRK